MMISDPSMISKWENLQNSRVFKYLPHYTLYFLNIYKLALKSCFDSSTKSTKVV